MRIQALKTRVFKENEDLVKFIFKYFKKIPERSILVITSKIVALSENRTVKIKNNKDKIALIKKESAFTLKTKHVWLTIKDNMVMPNAGIDESNAHDKMVLLPKDSFRTAKEIRLTLKKIYKIKNLGLIITDSRIFPFRSGVVGVALGYSGFKGIRNYVGKKDIFGRIFKMSKTDVADGLATVAVLCMGEGKEQQPFVLITDAPVEFIEKIDKKELAISPKDDIFYPLFKNIYGNNKKTK